MRVTATTKGPAETDADTVVIPVFDGKGIAHDVPDGTLQRLLDSGEARTSPKRLAVAHAEGRRWILVGLGDRDDLDAERLRVAAAVALGRARELGTRTLCWELPHRVGDDAAAAVVEGTMMAAWRYDRFRRRPEDEPPDVEALVVSDHDDRSAAVARAVVLTDAVDAARELQHAPPNHLTPAALGERASALEGVAVEVRGRDALAELGMGAFAAVAAASANEPALIVARHEPAGARGPVLGLVGKAVTFDSGGLSIKPASSMPNMKFDMSGGAAVLAAIGAVARLGLPVRVVGVVGATENVIGARAMRPGDVVTAADGTTIQIDNTDAEGRLVLADCLVHARSLGAERLVDVATLTGAIVSALGSTFTGLFASDDAWAGELQAAALSAGEPVWRMPLHEEFAALVKGSTADLTNAPEGRKAGSATAAEFLRHFTGGVPWVHLDIAGTAWDGGRAYAPKGGTGVMVRTLVALAERLAAAPAGGA